LKGQAGNWRKILKQINNSIETNIYSQKTGLIFGNAGTKSRNVYIQPWSIMWVYVTNSVQFRWSVYEYGEGWFLYIPIRHPLWHS
jgi:hypothetical protein